MRPGQRSTEKHTHVFINMLINKFIVLRDSHITQLIKSLNWLFQIYIDFQSVPQAVHKCAAFKRRKCKLWFIHSEATC